MQRFSARTAQFVDLICRSTANVRLLSFSISLCFSTARSLPSFARSLLLSLPSASLSPSVLLLLLPSASLSLSFNCSFAPLTLSFSSTALLLLSFPPLLFRHSSIAIFVTLSLLLATPSLLLATLSPLFATLLLLFATISPLLCHSFTAICHSFTAIYHSHCYFSSLSLFSPL